MQIPVVILGGGGHAKVLASIVKRLSKYQLLGYVDPEDRGSLLSAAYLGTDEVLSKLQREHPTAVAVLGFGFLGGADRRPEIVTRVRALGFSFPSIVSPDAVVSEGVEVGEGTVVINGAVVNSDARLGRFVILNTNCSIDHNCVLDDFVHVAPGATLSGGVEVGHGTLIGTGASVIQCRHIGSGLIIGAGAVVTADCLRPGTYVGVPARRIHR